MNKKEDEQSSNDGRWWSLGYVYVSSARRRWPPKEKKKANLAVTGRAPIP